MLTLKDHANMRRFGLSNLSPNASLQKKQLASCRSCENQLLQKSLSNQSWYNVEVADSAMFKYVKDLDKVSNQHMDPVRREACILSRMVVKLVDQDLELR